MDNLHKKYILNTSTIVNKNKTEVGSSNMASTCRMPSSQCRIIKLKSPQD